MATSSEIREALKLAAEQVANYVKDASEMTVKTQFMEFQGNGDAPTLVAESIVQFDGDCEFKVPVRRDTNNNLVPNTALYDLHEKNVQATIDYRVRMMEQLLALLRGT